MFPLTNPYFAFILGGEEMAIYSPTVEAQYLRIELNQPVAFDYDYTTRRRRCQYPERAFDKKSSIFDDVNPSPSPSSRVTGDIKINPEPSPPPTGGREGGLTLTHEPPK